MNSSEIVALFRSEMGDNTRPYLWEDSDAFRYLDEAQKRFCRETDGIADARTVAVTQLSVVPGTEWYPLHSSVLTVRQASRADTGRPISTKTVEQMEEAGLIFAATQVGPLKALVLGFEPRVARAYPMPNETLTVNLKVFRLPLVPITDDGDQVMEIDDQHHVSLVMWMKHMAYGKHDTEVTDMDKAETFEQRFLVYCAKAKREQSRARKAFGTIAYGGL